MKNRRVFLISSIFIILATLTFADFYFRVKYDAHETAYNELKTYSDQTCNAVNVTTDNSITSLKEMAVAFSNLEHMDTTEIVHILKHLSVNTNFTNLCVINKEGIGTFLNQAILDVSSRDYYLNGIKGQAGVSGITTSMVTGNKYLILYAPIYDVDMKVIGVIHGAYDMETLFRIIDVEGFNDKENTVLFQTSGALILGSQEFGNLDIGDNVFEYFEKYVDFTDEERDKFYQNISRGAPGYSEYTRDGVEYIGYYQPLKTNNWYIISVMTHNDFVTHIKEISRYAVTFFIRCIIIFCLMFIWTIRTEQKIKKAELHMIKEEHISQLLQEQRKSNELIMESINLARQANRTKSNFLSRMSHEIKTPINAIIGMNEKARKHLQQSAIQLECFQKIENASQQLLEMYKKILDNSEVQDISMKLSSEEVVKIPKLLELVENYLEDDLKEKEIKLTKRIQVPEDFEMITDQECLSLILINILRNAIRYSPYRSEIILKADITEDARSFAVCGFEVLDKMTEVTEKELSLLMNLYETGEDYYKEGNWIELRIAYNLTVIMNGLMTCSIKEGDGTIVHIDIPVKKSKAKAILDDSLNITEQNKEGDKKNSNESSNETCEINFSGKRILLVEDNDINMEIAKMYLEDMDIMITPATDGDIAFLSYMESPGNYFDLILTDIRMPNMDGRKLAKAVRDSDRPDAKTIPILAMSADAFSEDIKLSQSVGMNDYIMKPLQKDDLCAILKKYL